MSVEGAQGLEMGKEGDQIGEAFRPPTFTPSTAALLYLFVLLFSKPIN